MNESAGKKYNLKIQSSNLPYLSASGAETLVLESILEVFLPCVVECRNQQCCRTGVAGSRAEWGGVIASHTYTLTDELPLSQPGGEIMPTTLLLAV